MTTTEINDLINDFETNLRLVERSDLTISGYKSAMFAFLKHFNRNPKTITVDEIKKYLVPIPVYSRKTAIAAIKFFYKSIYNSKKIKLEYPALPEKIPVIFSVDEINQLVNASTNIKHRAIIIMLYTTAMRIDELINLKWSDIDRQTKQIRILKGKGSKGRIVPLTAGMIKQLELYCKIYKLSCFDSKTYVFRGQKKAKYSKRSVATFLVKYVELARIEKKITPHILRHCAATHWRDAGVDLADIQEILGHKHISTTNIYAKLTSLKNIPELGNFL